MKIQILRQIFVFTEIIIFTFRFNNQSKWNLYFFKRILIRHTLTRECSGFTAPVTWAFLNLSWTFLETIFVDIFKRWYMGMNKLDYKTFIFFKLTSSFTLCSSTPLFSCSFNSILVLIPIYNEIFYTLVNKNIKWLE